MVSASMGAIGWVWGGLGLYLVVYALLQFLPGLRARPSDAILGSDGLRIEAAPTAVWSFLGRSSILRRPSLSASRRVDSR